MGLRDRIAKVIGPAATQPTAQQPQQEQVPAPHPASSAGAGPQPQPQAAAQPPDLELGSQQDRPDGSQSQPVFSRPSGGGLRAKFQRSTQLTTSVTAGASQHIAPSQQYTYKFINGSLQRFEPTTAGGTTVAPSTQQQQQQPGTSTQAHPEHASLQGTGSTQLRAKQQQQQRQQQGDGIDRSSARAKVVLSSSQDDFDFDPSEALRRAAASGGRKAPAAPLAAGAAAAGRSQQQGGEAMNEIDDLLPGGTLTQRAASSKARGKRGGSATTPASVAKRKAATAAKAAAAKEAATSGGGASSKAGGGGRRKGAAPKRKRKEALPEDEEDSAFGEGEEANGGLADQLLLPPGAAPAASQQQGAQPPAQQGQVEPPAGGQQQAAQQEVAVRANAPLDGPEEELRMAVGEDGEPWPEDAAEEPYLDYSVPAAINRFLRSYQRDGIRFLMRQYARGTGGILADDMGLGKTVQAIGFVAAVLGKTGGPEDANEPPLEPLPEIEPIPDPEADLPPEEPWGLDDERYEPNYAACYPILVVAPTSVLSNWEREFDTWGKFRVAVCDSKHRDSAIADIRAGKKEVMIVSYPMLRNPVGEEILRIPWHLALFDEAHTLKNAKTQMYKVASRLPTRLRYGLTGTPFQNDYAEVWGVLDFVAPGCLGSKDDFMKGVAKPMMLGQKTSSTDEQKAAGAQAQQELRDVLSRFMLRRTKKLIASQLPTKRDYAVFCELSPLQLKAYSRLLESPDVELLFNYKKPCLQCGSGKEYFKCCGWSVEEDHGGVLWPMYHLCECDNPYDKLTNPKGCKSHKPQGCWRMTEKGWQRMCPFCLVLPTCSILRKISNHLELVKARHEDEHLDPFKFHKAKKVAELVIGEDVDALGGYVTDENFIRLRDTATCGKMEVLASLLAEWYQKGGNKVLLFSNSVQMLNILKQMITAKGYNYVMLDGSVRQEERQPLCDAFNTSPSTFIFLISTLAGGVGLNLTAANKVVIVDPSWNPAMDLQAQDRAFRIGQKRDVSVYRLIAAGTMEEIIYDRQLYKQMHSEIVVEGATDMPRTFEGAKTGSKEDHGELWGMVNLLMHNKESIKTMELLDRERRRRLELGEAAPAGYRVQEYDTAALEREAAQSRRRAGGAAADGEEDAGLQALVEAELGIPLDGAPEAPLDAPSQAGSPVDAAAAGGEPAVTMTQGGGRREAGAGSHHAMGGSQLAGAGAQGSQGQGVSLIAAELEAEERPEEHRAETELLAKAGVTGILHHSLAFKPSAAEAAATRAAAQAVEAENQRRQHDMAAAAAAGEAAKRPKTERAVRTRPDQVPLGGGGRVQVQHLSLLESLAEAMGLPVDAVAKQLLAMSPAGRQQLRREYARKDDPTIPLQPSEAEDEGWVDAP